MNETPEQGSLRQAHDVTVEKIARVYAEAVLGAAEKAGVSALLVDELDELVTGVLDRFPKMESLLATELVSEEQKRAIIDRVFSGRISKTTLGLLQILAQHGRLGILRSVAHMARHLWQARSGRVEIEVKYASAPEQALQLEVATALRSVLGGEPAITTTVDAELIAGFEVRVEDIVYDASARSRLERARQEMIERAHEAIQTRRGSFIAEN
jgi:F-type H+-transporting ATPase subunit delta